MTVGVLLETLRPVPALIRNPDCEGGDILTIWLRQASSSLRLYPRRRNLNFCSEVNMLLGFAMGEKNRAAVEREPSPRQEVAEKTNEVFPHVDRSLGGRSGSISI